MDKRKQVQIDDVYMHEVAKLRDSYRKKKVAPPKCPAVDKPRNPLRLWHFACLSSQRPWTVTEPQKYPLSWPDGWPRTASPDRQTSRFWKPARRNGDSWTAGKAHSMEESFEALKAEVSRLTQDIGPWFLSSNVERRRTGGGLPYSGRAQPTDTGAAVYFKINGRDVSLACDKWDRVEDNVWALAKHIEALRGQERWGVGSVEQAFRGYMALPGIGEGTGIKWWEVLGVPINSAPEQVKDAYRLLVKKHHPDKGGEVEFFHRLQEAYRLFEQNLPKAA